jgi:hypothetical protein
MAEQIRQILVEEQDHQIDLATALGIEVPDVSGVRKDAAWASVASSFGVASPTAFCRILRDRRSPSG